MYDNPSTLAVGNARIDALNEAAIEYCKGFPIEERWYQVVGYYAKEVLGYDIPGPAYGRTDLSLMKPPNEDPA